MADLSDVTIALAKMASDALYPGQVSPSGNSVAGLPVLVQTGWPDPKSLQTMLAAGKAQVTVYPLPAERNTTRYPRNWKQGPLLAKTFTLRQQGQTITVGGAQPASYYRHNFAVLVSGKPYLYSAIAGDNAAAIALALFNEIAVDFPSASIAGAVITLPALARIGSLRIGTSATAWAEVKRQERQFQITVWAATLAARDAIAAPIDVAIALNQWLVLDAMSRGRLRYKGSPYTDFDQKQGIFRRDLVCTVEYPTIATQQATEVIAARAEYWLNRPDLLGTEGGLDIVTGVGANIHLSNPDLSTIT